MKIPKKKKSKEELEIDAEAGAEEEVGRPIPFEALAELTSSDVIAQVKRGMSSVEPLDFEDEFKEDTALGESGTTARPLPPKRRPSSLFSPHFHPLKAPPKHHDPCFPRRMPGRVPTVWDD